MKYRVSPLHFISLISLAYAINLQLEISKHNGVGLGGLFPYIFTGIAFGILAIDLIIQLIFQNYKTWLYVVEFAVILLGFFAFLKAEQKQTLIITEKKPQYIRLIYGVDGQPKLSTNLFIVNYDIEVPSYGTILTSTTIETHNGYFDFTWKDGSKIAGDWNLIPIESNGKYYCEGRDKSINYRLFYLTDTGSWEMDSSWFKPLRIDFETANQLLIQCQ